LGRDINAASFEGRFLRAFEKMLTEHVGGNPSIVQRTLISRAARVALHLELMDEATLVKGHTFGLHDHNYYVSWNNSFTRLLVAIGVESVPVKPPTLAELIAEHERAAG
jgi:hypothetical protein